MFDDDHHGGDDGGGGCLVSLFFLAALTFLGTVLKWLGIGLAAAGIAALFARLLKGTDVGDPVRDPHKKPPARRTAGTAAQDGTWKPAGPASPVPAELRADLLALGVDDSDLESLDPDLFRSAGSGKPEDRELAAYRAFLRAQKGLDIPQALREADAVIVRLSKEEDPALRARILSFFNRYLPLMTEIFEAVRQGDRDLSDAVGSFPDIVKAFSDELYNTDEIVEINQKLIGQLAEMDGLRQQPSGGTTHDSH